MSTLATNFMKSILGDDGHQAFDKMSRRAPTLAALLTPRTVISWLSTAAMIDYEGEIPGIENSYLALTKNSDGLDGALVIGDVKRTFVASDILHVAAAVSYALGVGSIDVDPTVKNTDISKLGKSIDLLVKARTIAYVAKEEMAKAAELPGQAAAARPPQEAQAPQAPMKQPQQRLPPKPPMMKRELIVKQKDAGKKCKACGQAQFKDNKFSGCVCFRALAKGVVTEQTADGYTLRLNRSQWDDETVQTLMSTFRG